MGVQPCFYTYIGEQNAVSSVSSLPYSANGELSMEPNTMRCGNIRMAWFWDKYILPWIHTESFYGPHPFCDAYPVREHCTGTFYRMIPSLETGKSASVAPSRASRPSVFERNVKLAEQVESLAHRKGSTSAQVAIQLGRTA